MTDLILWMKELGGEWSPSVDVGCHIVGEIHGRAFRISVWGPCESKLPNYRIFADVSRMDPNKFDRNHETAKIVLEVRLHLLEFYERRLQCLRCQRQGEA